MLKGITLPTGLLPGTETSEQRNIHLLPIVIWFYYSSCSEGNIVIHPILYMSSLWPFSNNAPYNLSDVRNNFWRTVLPHPEWKGLMWTSETKGLLNHVETSSANVELCVGSSHRIISLSSKQKPNCLFNWLRLFDFKNFFISSRNRSCWITDVQFMAALFISSGDKCPLFWFSLAVLQGCET